MADLAIEIKEGGLIWELTEKRNPEYQDNLREHRALRGYHSFPETLVRLVVARTLKAASMPPHSMEID